MKISFWSIGKAHEPMLKKAVEEFTQRVGRYYKTEWHIIPPPKNAASLSETELKKKEAELVLDLVQPGDHLVALDENGKQMSSKKLATFIQARTNESTKHLIFLIGGAYGLDVAVIQKAAFSWSLSDLTFPHQLVRLILAEQVYRACTIIRNEKYHHQ
ncbi:MAG TPA: 23S rRNA (pseudouridine(1915)-N(3))-methyltransferase RlmH [Chitinophagaceae bacterium]|nr:23S rRNA (pseudouridine(1915)-N(3))-methyltransferase RlmH [Chitinophagaceae bacterium]MCB9055745.1 23S rRNA (pseudouridine(1915)-N(3))-methyltransferase RlmH [Chitinophagales bacterium]HPG10570.1 23S rRNA (pseudouridine(1915)-N(3))-methyltransferase RlmH [Chitinophagaceae bacterium]